MILNNHSKTHNSCARHIQGIHTMKKCFFIFLLLGIFVGCEKQTQEPEMNYPKPEDFPTSPTEESTPDKPNVPSGATPTKNKYVVNGALPGVFSISETKSIHFSQGNLQYNPKKNEWRFAEEQYIYTMNESYSNITTTTDAWFCEFCWGQSGYNGNSITSSGYPSSMFDIQSISDTNYDWGIYNPISNGGNKAGLWFCMSSDEWNYLFTHCHHAYGKANGVKGIFLIPNNFVCPENIPFIIADGESTFPNSELPAYTCFYNEGQFASDNIFSSTQLKWLEAAGAVFIPISNDFIVDWYSTATGSPIYREYIHLITLSSNSISWGCYGDPKNFRHMVRLVQFVN